MIERSVPLLRIATMFLLGVVLQGCGEPVNEPEAGQQNLEERQPGEQQAGRPEPGGRQAGAPAIAVTDVAESAAAHPNDRAPAPDAATPDPATQAVLSRLGELTSPGGFQPYQIRPPAGYTVSTRDDADDGKVFRWMGPRYRVTAGGSSAHYLNVAIRTGAPDTTTAEQELKRKLQDLSASKLEWQQGETTSETINGIPFLRCEYKYRHDASRPPSEGFLYAAVDGGTVVLMNAARYNVGSRDPLELADASARTIQKAVESAQQPAEIAQQPVEITPAPAGTQEALSQLGEFVSPNGFRPYQIRPPADYTPSTLDLPEGRVFRWAGSRYKSTPKRSSQHFLTVTLRKRASDTTAQEELEGQLKKLSSFKLKWQQGENTSETINGIPFLRCDYKYRRFPEEPVAEGFLYAALHDGTLVLMHSEQYDVVSRDHLELAQVSARTFQKQPESAPPPVVVQAVDRWKTFEPPTVQPVEFQPPPLDPEPVPDATDRLQLAKEDRLVALALQKARAERLGIFARFEPRADGSLKALINPGPTPDALTKSTLEQPLTFGNGIPLLRLDVPGKASARPDSGWHRAPPTTRHRTIACTRSSCLKNCSRGATAARFASCSGRTTARACFCWRAAIC